MNKRETSRLSRRIEREEPTVLVTGTRSYGGGRYSLDAVDTVSGYPLAIHSEGDWDARIVARRFAAEYYRA